MAGSIVSPDELVEQIIEDVIVECLSEARLAQLWAIVARAAKAPTVTPSYQAVVWSWLNGKPEIEVFLDGELAAPGQCADLARLLAAAADDPDRICVRIAEAKQYLYLTGRPKEGNPIGSYPFNLLKHIVARREKGISGAELARVADQDPRSLSGRLALLQREGLIRKKSTEMGGVATSLNIHTRFYVKGQEAAPTIDKTAINQRIVAIIRSSRNQIRTQRDVAEEMGYGGSLLSLRRFRRLTSKLCAKGCLKSVLVAPDTRSDRRATTRALMYIKDYTADRQMSDDDDDDDADVDADDADADADEEDTLAKIEDQETAFLDPPHGHPILTTHFPFLNQIHELVAKSGPNGLPIMDINRTIVGKNAYWFTRYFPEMKICVPAGLEHLYGYNLVKVADSEGKIKFYRYFTQNEYARLTGAAVPSNSGEFAPQDHDREVSLLALSITNARKQTNGGMDVVRCSDGAERVSWIGVTDPLIRKLNAKRAKSADILTSTSFVSEATGELVFQYDEKLTAQAKKKLAGANRTETRGRPKKGSTPAGRKRAPVEDVESVKPTKQSRFGSEFDIVLEPVTGPASAADIIETFPKSSQRPDLKVEEVERAPSAVPPAEGPKLNFNFNLAPGGSLRANQRRGELLEIIKENGGLAPMDLALCRLLGSRLQLSTLIDKATLRKDVELLRAEGIVDVVKFVGEDSSTPKAILVDAKRRISEQQIKQFVEQHKVFSRPAINSEPEVVRAALEFKNVSAPKAFRPRSRPVGSLESKSSTAKLAKKKPERKPRVAEEELDPMMTYLSSNMGLRRKAVGKKRVKGIKTEAQQVRGRVRGSYQTDYIIAVAKAHTIVNSLAVNKTVLDWKSVAAIVADESQHEKIRRRWPHIRRQLRYATLPRIKEAWERFLSASVKNGSVTFAMLKNLDYKAMYDLWSENEIDDFQEDSSLFAHIEDNLAVHDVKLVKEDTVVFSSLVSSLDKSRLLKSCAFTRPVSRKDRPEDPYDTTKAVLKSIFSTDNASFDPAKTKAILKRLDDYVPALKQLEVSKEIAFLGESAENKFAIPEKTWFMFQHKFSGTFLEGAAALLRGFQEVADAGKGMVVSPMAPDHTVMALLHLVVQGEVKLTLVDRVVQKNFAGYFTRHFNKAMLESDIVVSRGPKFTAAQEALPAAPIPLGGPCSRVWIDMDGNLKPALWRDIVVTVLYHVYFRPGIDFNGIYEQTRALIASFELSEVLQWLQTKRAVSADHTGYYASPFFYTVTG